MQIRTLEVLDAAACARVRASIDALRRWWVVRSFTMPFYTLGAAAYLDARGSRLAYYQMARCYNPILRDNFSWLYACTANRLAEALEEPVRLTKRQALPGFHIYLYNKVFEAPIASRHCDSQYTLLDWCEGPCVDLDHPLSFTLAITIPHNGGGLFHWDITAEDVAGDGRRIEALLSTRCRSYQPYRPGALILHSGRQLHQAAPGVDLSVEDRRVTLQGHAVHSTDGWELYW